MGKKVQNPDGTAQVLNLKQFRTRITYFPQDCWYVLVALFKWRSTTQCEIMGGMRSRRLLDRHNHSPSIWCEKKKSWFTTT